MSNNKGKKIQLDAEVKVVLDEIVHAEAAITGAARMAVAHLRERLWDVIHKAHPEAENYSCSYDAKKGIVILEQKQPEGSTKVMHIAGMLTEAQREALSAKLN